MLRKCDDCAHSNVCIYKKKYQENYETLEKELYDKPFSIELNCDEYGPRNYNLRILHKGLEIDTTPYPYNIIKTSSYCCEGCSVYKDIKQGKPVVNDACSFCSKNP